MGNRFICLPDDLTQVAYADLSPEARAELDEFAEYLKSPRPRIGFQKWRQQRAASTENPNG